MWFTHDNGSFSNGSHEPMTQEEAALYMTRFEEMLRFEQPLTYRDQIKALRAPEDKDPLQWALWPVTQLQEVPL